MRILVSLHADRDKLGTLEVVDEHGEVLLDRVPCLGRSDDKFAAQYSNPYRNPVLRGGDLPTGVYACKLMPAFKEPAYWHSYGPNGYISLAPVRGQALLAQANHRTGFLAHGGELNDGPAYAKWGGLRCTHGCLRLSNEHIKAVCELPGWGTGVIEMEVTEVSQ